MMQRPDSMASPIGEDVGLFSKPNGERSDQSKHKGKRLPGRSVMSEDSSPRKHSPRKPRKNKNKPKVVGDLEKSNSAENINGGSRSKEVAYHKQSGGSWPHVRSQSAQLKLPDTSELKSSSDVSPIKLQRARAKAKLREIRDRSWSGTFDTRFVPRVKNFVKGLYVVITVGALKGQKGMIAFVGNVKFASGQWVGVALDNPVASGDGAKHGVRYFSCAPKSGVFLKAAMLRPLESDPGGDEQAVPVVKEEDEEESVPALVAQKRPAELQKMEREKRAEIERRREEEFEKEREPERERERKRKEQNRAKQLEQERQREIERKEKDAARERAAKAARERKEAREQQEREEAERLQKEAEAQEQRKAEEAAAAAARAAANAAAAKAAADAAAAAAAAEKEKTLKEEQEQKKSQGDHLKAIDIAAAGDEDSANSPTGSPMPWAKGRQFRQTHKIGDSGYSDFSDMSRTSLDGVSDYDPEDEDAAEFLWEAEDGHLDQVKAMLAEHPTWVNYRDEEGETALHKSARQGHGEVVEMIIDAGGNVNASSREWHTPLLYATMSGHSEVIDLLLHAKANPNCKDKLGNFPLVACAGWSPNPVESLTALLRSRALDFTLKDSRGDTALSWAIKGGRADIIRLMQIAVHHQRCRKAFMLGLVRKTSPVHRSFAAQPHFMDFVMEDIFEFAGVEAGMEKAILDRARLSDDSDDDDDDDESLSDSQESEDSGDEL